MSITATKPATVVASDRLWSFLMALAPGMVYLAGRLAGLWTLRWVAGLRHRDFVDALSEWDGEHFIAIAEHGYSWSAASAVKESPAFFPALPKLMALVSWLSGCSVQTAGLLISAAAGLVAAYGLMQLAARVPGVSRGGGLILVAVFSLAPMSIVLSMSYTEALYCAVAVWCLVFLLRGNWLAAGGLSALAGVVRPSGIALAGAIGVAALVAIARGRSSWQTWVGAMIAPLGFVGYVGYVGYRLNDAMAWFTLQRVGWHSDFDFGVGSWHYVLRVLQDAPSVLDVATLGLMVASLVLLVMSIRQRQPFELIAYSAVVLVQVLGSDGIMNSKGRLLIPAFTLLIPLAVFLNRERRSNAVGGLVVLGLISCWYSAYALVIYGFAI